jgi:DHA2 family multidrug resistance protein-like MFS transporter
VHDASRLHPTHADDTLAMDPRRRTLALIVLCLCALTTAIDITITNVALPFIGKDLDASVAGLQLVIDAYNIVLAGLLILGGGLADRFGRRRIFLGGYVLFGVSCVLAALSSSTGALIGARIVMGVGAAAVIAPALAIVATMYPSEERARAIAAWAVFGASGLALGPVIGGVLLAHFWWGSVFLVNVPLVAVGVIVGLFVIPESTKPGADRLDLLGAAFSVAGLGLLLGGVIEGPQQGWTSAAVVAPLIAGVVLTVAFVRHELRAPAPLFDVRVLTRRVVSAGATTLLVCYAVFTGMLFLVPQWLQGVQGQSITTVGLLLVPFAGIFGLVSLRSADAVARFGERTIITCGLACCALGGLGLAVLQQQLVGSIAATALIGLGLAGLIAPASTVVMNELPEAKAGDGSSLNMVSRFVGGAVSVAVVGSLLSSVYRPRILPAAGVSGAQLAEARGSLQGALEVVGRLGPRGPAFASTVHDAFNAGAQVGYLVIALASALAALWVWRALAPRAEAAVSVTSRAATT